MIDTNVTGTVYLIQKIARDIRARNEGKILITGSITGFMPGTYQAGLQRHKSVSRFLFLRHPGRTERDKHYRHLPDARGDGNRLLRARGHDGQVGTDKKDDPADVAKTGFEAMMDGKGDVVSGWYNKLQSAIANVTPAGMLAEQHRIEVDFG